MARKYCFIIFFLFYEMDAVFFSFNKHCEHTVFKLRMGGGDYKCVVHFLNLLKINLEEVLLMLYIIGIVEIPTTRLQLRY